MSCNTVSLGSSVNCDDLPQAGTEARIILLNYDDVEFIGTLNGKITSIVLAANTTGFEFFGFRNDVKKNESVPKVKRFSHSVSFIVYEITQLQKNNLQKMAKGRFIAVVENKGKGDDAFELLGRECGMKIVQGIIRDPFETLGMYTISLATPENGVEYERKLPQTIGEDYDNGAEIVDGLLESVGIFDDTFDATFE